MKIIVVLFSIFYFLFSFPTNAAELYFGTHSQEVHAEETFEVGVFLNTEGEDVNAVEGTVRLPSSLALTDIRDGGSIVTLWITRPARGSPGEIKFRGALPGGYKGTRGFLFFMIVRAQGDGHVTITIADERVLRNDGRGTPVATHRAPLTLTVRLASQEANGVEDTQGAEAVIAPDVTPPAPFTLEVAHDPTVFDGRWFVAFVANDQESGIDHYEVQENRTQKIENRNWNIAESPYALKDQALRSYVFVRAVDRAGNQRLAMRSPEHLARYGEFAVYAISAMILAAALMGIRNAVRRGR